MNYDVSFEELILYDFGRPGVSVTAELRLGNLTVSVDAKIDTGAENCIFSRDCAARLGLDIESGELQQFNTVTGSFWTYSHRVNLIVAGYEFDSLIYFAADDSFNRNVLGRFGWLDRMIIGLNDYEGKLYLRKYE